MSDSINLVINGLQHIGIPVRNIDISKAVYNRLGFDKVMEAPFLHEGQKGNCCMMKRGSIMIELYQMPPKAISNIRSRKDGHIDHIAFDVPDINEAFSTLESTGFHIIEESPVFLQFWEKGCKYFNITGPDGERLESNQVR